MASKLSDGTRKSIVKRTCQGGKCKTSSMNKSRAKTFKKYRGQGR